MPLVSSESEPPTLRPSEHRSFDTDFQFVTCLFFARPPLGRSMRLLVGGGGGGEKHPAFKKQRDSSV